MHVLHPRHFKPAKRPGLNVLRNQRRIIYACEACFAWHEGRGRPTQCRICQRQTGFHRFDSRIEAVYAAELRLRQQAGEITSVVFHPRFVARVHAIDGKDSTITWTPDGAYTDRQGNRVVYDVKPKGAPLDPIHKLKERIYKDILAATIVIVRR